MPLKQTALKPVYADKTDQSKTPFGSDLQINVDIEL